MCPGQPLLRRGSGPRDHAPHYVDHSYAASLAPDLATSSVVLSVGEDGTPAFAVNMAAAGDTVEVESRTLATFTDLRVGLFLVNQEVAHTLSKVTTFTTGEQHHL